MGLNKRFIGKYPIDAVVSTIISVNKFLSFVRKHRDAYIVNNPRKIKKQAREEMNERVIRTQTFMVSLSFIIETTKTNTY